MPDYKEMYKKMFVAATRAIEILKDAQLEAEDMYISSAEGLEKMEGTKLIDFQQPSGD